MKKYTKEEIIDELAMNMYVMWTGYGTWKISSYIGNRDNKISFSEITHQEEDEKGIFDGEDYEEWRKAVIHDSANEDNYESRDQRDKRLAERIFDHNFAEDPTAGEYIICQSGDENFYFLETDAERQAFDENMNYWLFGDLNFCNNLTEFKQEVEKIENE